MKTKNTTSLFEMLKPNCSILGSILGRFGVQNRILHVKLYIFPAGYVYRPKIWSKHVKYEKYAITLGDGSYVFFTFSWVFLTFQ